MLSFLMKTKLPHLYDRIVSCYFFTVTKDDKCGCKSAPTKTITRQVRISRPRCEPVCRTTNGHYWITAWSLLGRFGKRPKHDFVMQQSSPQIVKKTSLLRRHLFFAPLCQDLSAWKAVPYTPFRGSDFQAQLSLPPYPRTSYGGTRILASSQNLRQPIFNSQFKRAPPNDNQ